ncbi:MAG: thioesterase [Spirochaetota bacterium]|nr:thioesterase [Spirochaetota bacterium]
MPRIQLNALKAYNFSCYYKINVNDINLWGHVGIPEIIAIIHVVRRDVLRSLGFDEHDLGDNSALIIADVAINLMKELHLDDEIIIDTTIGEIGNKSFRFFHRVCHNNSIAAIIEMGAVIIDKITRKPIFISKEFLNTIAGLSDTILQESSHHKN